MDKKDDKKVEPKTLESYKGKASPEIDYSLLTYVVLTDYLENNENLRLKEMETRLTKLESKVDIIEKLI